MKVTNGKSTEESPRLSKKFESEHLRGLRIENDQRIVSGYGRLAITGFTIVSFVVVMILAGRGMLLLSPAALTALTVTIGIVIRGYFSRRE